MKTQEYQAQDKTSFLNFFLQILWNNFQLKRNAHILQKRNFSPEICQMRSFRCNGSKLWYPHLVSFPFHPDQIENIFLNKDENIFIDSNLNPNLSKAEFLMPKLWYLIPTSHILSFSSRSNRKCLSKYIYRFKFQI